MTALSTALTRGRKAFFYHTRGNKEASHENKRCRSDDCRRRLARGLRRDSRSCAHPRCADGRSPCRVYGHSCAIHSCAPIYLRHRLPAPTAAESRGEKITLRLWSHSGPAFQEANQALIDKFTAQNPNVEVKYETFDYDTYIQNLPDLHGRRDRGRCHRDVRDVDLLLREWRAPGRGTGGRNDLRSGEASLLQSAAGWLLLRRQAVRASTRVQLGKWRRGGQPRAVSEARRTVSAAVEDLLRPGRGRKKDDGIRGGQDDARRFPLYQRRRHCLYLPRRNS